VGGAVVTSIGLVHDYLLVMRGAERTFHAMAECWPAAPISTALYSEAGTEERFARRTIQTSPLQRLGLEQGAFRRLLPLYPWAIERLALDEHDVVVSSSSAFAKGVRPRPGAVHVCYCHNPFRYAWHERRTGLDEMPAPVRPLLDLTLERIRRWDREASDRVTHFVANSEIVRRRIAEFYDRDSVVVHPPVDTDRFRPGEPEDYLLTVCELVRHKRLDRALEAAARAGRRVRVVGTGPDLGRLQARFGDTAEFLGRVSDGELAGLYARAAALIVPGVEEFGIAAVEAQAAGRPVIAPAAGGTLETVVDGVTGIHTRSGTVDELTEILREVDFHRFTASAIVRNAERFSRRRFQQRLTEVVDAAASTRPARAPLGRAA
jgi:glycosyltransferase involved in cell wall biosynthesis